MQPKEKTALEILTEMRNKKYAMQPYETHHLHHNYEDLVLSAMNNYAAQEAIAFKNWCANDNEYFWNHQEQLTLTTEELYARFREERESQAIAAAKIKEE